LRLLYCGRFERGQKRILDLVRLGQILNERRLPWQISLAGGGPDESLLRQEITAAGLDRSFQFLGILDPCALEHEYRRNDALIITSTWETGPIVAWQAMSFGLPVITSRYAGSGLEGALVHGRNCLMFPVGDMKSAAESVEHCMNREVREQLVRGGLELVRARYTREVSISLWHAALEHTLALPPLPTPESQRGPTRAAGRLDKLLGPAAGEKARRVLGVRYRHAGPGGEWPHTRNIGEPPRIFLEHAFELDQSGP